MSVTTTIANVSRPVIKFLELLAPIADLGIRYYAAKWFLASAMTKVVATTGFPFVEFSFFPFPKLGPSTIMLFKYEYKVPVLSPELAAYMGTYTEFFFPLLLIIGLASRFSAAVLIAFNFIAMISYPTLNEAGVAQHILFGIMLLLPLTRGPGMISVDHFIRRKYMNGS